MSTQIQSTLDTSTEESSTEVSGSRLAKLLRWAGIGIFGLSAVVYLLQGFDSVDGLLRNWTYLLMMVTVGLLGVGVHRWLQDDKSARVLLGLGVALIPVQFAQFAGRLHDWVGTGTSALLSGAGAMDTRMLLLGGLCSLALAVPVAFAGFRVMARSQAKFLSIALLSLAGLLLLPWREGYIALFILLGLIGGSVIVDRRFTQAGVESRTVEGRSVRLMLMIPALIAVTRFAFYIDTLAGVSALGSLVGISLIAASRIYCRQGTGRELLFGLGVATIGLAVVPWALIEFDGHYFTQLILALASVALIWIAELSSNARSYRFMGSLMLFLCTTHLLFESELPSVMVMLLGVAITLGGYAVKRREPIFAGVGLVLLTAGVMSLDALVHIDVTSWLGLAGMGIMLVLIAAVLERHGRGLMHRTSEGWNTLKSWT